jgi:hypothetical protein
MGIGKSREQVNCEDPLIISARYPSIIELRKDFKNLYDSIPENKRVSYTIVIDKGQSGQTHVITGIYDKNEAYPKMFKKYFNNKSLEESLEESEGLIESFGESPNKKHIILLIILILAIIYRKDIANFFK